MEVRYFGTKLVTGLLLVIQAPLRFMMMIQVNGLTLLQLNSVLGMSITLEAVRQSRRG